MDSSVYRIWRNTYRRLESDSVHSLNLASLSHCTMQLLKSARIEACKCGIQETKEGYSSTVWHDASPMPMNSEEDIHSSVQCHIANLAC